MNNISIYYAVSVLIFIILFFTIVYFIETNNYSRIDRVQKRIDSKIVFNYKFQKEAIKQHNSNRHTRRLMLRLLKRLKKCWFNLPLYKRNISTFLEYALPKFNRNIMRNYRSISLK